MTNVGVCFVPFFPFFTSLFHFLVSLTLYHRTIFSDNSEVFHNSLRFPFLPIYYPRTLIPLTAGGLHTFPLISRGPLISPSPHGGPRIFPLPHVGAGAADGQGKQSREWSRCGGRDGVGEGWVVRYREHVLRNRIQNNERYLHSKHSNMQALSSCHNYYIIINVYSCNTAVL